MEECKNTEPGAIEAIYIIDRRYKRVEKFIKAINENDFKSLERLINQNKGIQRIK